MHATADQDDASERAARTGPDDRAVRPRDDDPRDRRVEMLATILLTVAAVATAWSTYQSTRWRGEQAVNSSMATAAHIASAEASTRAGQLTQIDVNAFSQWIDAEVGGEVELAEFYHQRLRDEFRPAFDAWLATEPRTNPDAPSTPFEMSEYQVSEATRAQEFNAEAIRHAHSARAAIQRSDEYMLAVVFFATSLFFAGISSKFRSPRGREVLVGVGVVSFLGAATWVMTLLLIDSF